MELGFHGSKPLNRTKKIKFSVLERLLYEMFKCAFRPLLIAVADKHCMIMFRSCSEMQPKYFHSRY